MIGRTGPAGMHRLEPLLSPRSVAVVGASRNLTRGTLAVSGLLRAGYAGSIYPVNPKYSEVSGLRCYPSLDALPEGPDCAVVAVPASASVGIVGQCAALGVPAAILLASGFAEAGPEGQALQDALVRTAGNTVICGPNCLGLVNFHRRTPLGMLPDRLLPGPVGAVLQSGVLAASLMDPILERGVGFSFLISSGNEAVVQMADYLDFLVDDPRTEVITVFIEGLKNPGAFMRAAARALEVGKPIIALKIGRSEMARAAVVAHTGSLAGSDEACDAMFRQYGVVRAHDLNDLVETALLFAGGRRPRGNRLAVLTFSGGGCGLVGDVANEAGFEVPTLAPETVRSLGERLPPYATVSNPLDLTGSAAEDPQLFPDCLATLLGAEEVDMVAVGLSAGLGGGGAAMYRERSAILAGAARNTGKLLFGFSFTSTGFDPAIVANMASARAPLLQGTREAIESAKRVAWYSERRARGGPPAVANPSSHQASALALVGGRRGVLTERESKRLLALYGLPVTRERLARTAGEAAVVASDLGYPVVLKIESPDIAHKSDVGGVRMGLGSDEEVRATFGAMVGDVLAAAPAARIHGVLVQEQVAPGVELILGVKHDAQFGPLVLVGLGGVLVEVLRRFSLARTPLADRDAAELLARLPGGEILGPVRGRGPRDSRAVVDALLALSTLATDLGPRLAAVDLNPAIVGADGEGLKVVDALVVLA